MNTNEFAQYEQDIDKILEADASGGSGNMGPGMWHVALEKPFFKQSQASSKRFFIVPFSVISTTNPDANRGDRLAWKPDVNNLSGPSNVKNFLLAVGQSLWENFDAQQAKGPDGRELMKAVLRGEYVDDLQMLAHAWEQPTKDKKGVFTKVSWAPYSDLQRTKLFSRVPKVDGGDEAESETGSA